MRRKGVGGGPGPWDEAWQGALMDWMGVENLEERTAAPGWIDPRVLEFLRVLFDAQWLQSALDRRGIALPLALIAGLGWLATSLLRRRRRESVLA